MYIDKVIDVPVVVEKFIISCKCMLFPASSPARSVSRESTFEVVLCTIPLSQSLEYKEPTGRGLFARPNCEHTELSLLLPRILSSVVLHRCVGLVRAGGSTPHSFLLVPSLTLADEGDIVKLCTDGAARQAACSTCCACVSGASTICARCP